MGRYFFHVDSGAGLIADTEGSDCDDVKAACKLAVIAVTEMAAEDLKAGTERIEQRVIVADEAGAQLLTVKVEAAIHVDHS